LAADFPNEASEEIITRGRSSWVGDAVILAIPKKKKIFR